MNQEKQWNEDAQVANERPVTHFKTEVHNTLFTYRIVITTGFNTQKSRRDGAR
jgi:hypothetical protein